MHITVAGLGVWINLPSCLRADRQRHKADSGCGGLRGPPLSVKSKGVVGAVFTSTLRMVREGWGNRGSIELSMAWSFSAGLQPAGFVSDDFPGVLPQATIARTFGPQQQRLPSQRRIR